MLQITSGSSERLPYSMDSLADDKVVAIMDEIHKVIWLWMGSNTGLVQRRGAMRVAQSLKTYGHEIGPTIVGRNLEDVISVDAKKIFTGNDPLMKGRYEKIKELFDQDFKIEADVLAVYKSISLDDQPSYYGLSREQRDNLVQAAIDAPTVGDDDREIEQIVGQYRPPPEKSSPEIPVTPIAPAPSSAPKQAPIAPQPIEDSAGEVTDNLLGEVKASILISSVLSELNDIFVSTIDDDSGKKEYFIENADGLVCKFLVDGSNIRFRPDSWELVDNNTKRTIQKVFIDRTKKLLGS
jgi:hypothetical protein